MCAAKDVDFFNAVHSEPFECVVEHRDVDEGEKDFRGLCTDWAETLEKKTGNEDLIRFEAYVKERDGDMMVAV
jgi:hypothetical protein